MKRRLFWATVVYVASIGFVLWFIYETLVKWGFSPVIYLYTSVIVMVMGWMFGVIFLSTVLEPKERLDANLLHLLREILHELNIPITTIRANSTMLKRGIDDEKNLKRISRIEASTVRLERLYKELIYGIKKQIFPIEKESFELRVLLQERTETLSGFEQNRFELQLQSMQITADKIGFEKMIDNLLINAMKYSPKESPIVVRLENSVLEIIDYGVGMSDTELLRIFERYYQTDTAQKGEGIGLSLVKSYCDSEGIEIRIQSCKNQGTTVSLYLKSVGFGIS